MTYRTIELTIDGPLATLRLNRPEQRNGMTELMGHETFDAVTKVSQREDIRVLLFTGAGKWFCPGADLSMAGEEDPDQDADVYGEFVQYQVPVVLHNMPQVTVAAINGACAGAAFGWVCACDIRVAKESAMLNTAFLDVAVAGDMCLPWSLPRLVGASKARELSFLCEKFSAPEAQRIGLVARVFSDEEFDAETAALVTRLVDSSPTALLTMKAHYLAAESGLPLQTFSELEAERHIKILDGPHAMEAMHAFLEKRKPNFE